MTEFEYISVLLSIVIGLSVTQLLSGTARLLRDGRALAPAWWVFVIVATLLFANLQLWWVSFGWRHVAEWTFFDYLAFMVGPVLLYLLAYLVLPGDLHLDGRALADAFISKRKPFYAVLFLVSPATYFQQWMLTGHLPFDLDSGLRALWMVLAIPGFLSRRVAVQATIAVASLLLLVVYVTLLFQRMG
jgi:hypothetical protein